MNIPDPISANLARQNVLDAKSRTRDALQKLEEESIRIRESGDKFYNSLALFSGGTIALSVTFLGYLKQVPNRSIAYPKTLIASWIALMICAVASLFCTLLSSYYVHFARLKTYVDRLAEQKETLVEEMDKLYIVNVTTQEEKEREKKRFTEEAKARRKDVAWAKRREEIFNALWRFCGWTSRIAFPVGLGLLTFFAAKNM